MTFTHVKGLPQGRPFFFEPTMTSHFRMQIVDTRTGDVVEWEPGLKVETDFIEDIIVRTRLRGVGLFKTTQHVENDLRVALDEAIFDLKRKIAAAH